MDNSTIIRLKMSAILIMAVLIGVVGLGMPSSYVVTVAIISSPAVLAVLIWLEDKGLDTCAEKLCQRLSSSE